MSYVFETEAGGGSYVLDSEAGASSFSHDAEAADASPSWADLVIAWSVATFSWAGSRSNYSFDSEA